MATKAMNTELPPDSEDTTTMTTSRVKGVEGYKEEVALEVPTLV